MKVNLPLNDDIMYKLKSGDLVYLSGIIYTARDAAHKKLKELIDNNQDLPVNLNNQIIYYAGPTPTKEGSVVGSIGPTTSTRMDSYTDMIINIGVSATIGKGPRNEYSKKSSKDNKIIYFIATGGIGALLSKCVIKNEVVAFDELGCESIKKLEIKDFPVIVAYDIHGNDIFLRENKTK